MGERVQQLEQAIQKLDNHPHIAVEQHSAMYETAPVGFIDQPAFINMAIRVSTSLAPEALLEVMLQIELELGRERKVHWGPRTIDLDLLWMRDVQWQSERLSLPHPYLFERAFVLVPLLDCLSDSDQVLQQQVEQALASLSTLEVSKHG
jgi:2-amino-4-hydroxy-6-hydroxymethyldihydropteridine diphosphokinase